MLTLIALMDNEVGAPRILFVTFPEPGHFNPILRVAQRASQRGATVAFFSLQGDLSQRLARAGVHAPSSYPRHADARTITAKREHRAEDFVARVRRGGAWYRQWLRYVLLDLVEPQRNELEKFVKEFRPDVISTDPLAYTGSIVADVAGIPWAAVSTNLVGAVPAGTRSTTLPRRHGFAMAEHTLHDGGADAARAFGQ
jgi:zeaxanthin glucosyltransferase